ncbi:MAG: phage protease [Burkholderiales bacterium]|nr:phage protease [Burkholderiales bacterium]
MNRKNPQLQIGVVACAISATPGNEIQLFPAGEFRASDGRPRDVPAWVINAEIATSIIADFESRENLTVIDFEHQTLMIAQNGQPAPASGWFGKLEWRESGLFAVDVEWTERASGMIASGEYRYISPVFTYDKKTGAVKKILHAALTNNPALDGMDAVAATKFSHLIDETNKESLSMDKLLEDLRWMLNLPVTATQDEIAAELQKALDQIKATDAAATAATDFSIVALVKSQADQIAALTAAATNPDPTRFAPVSMVKDLQDQVAVLTAANLDREIDEVVQAALTAGKLLPTQEIWARQHGKENLVSLKQFIENAQPVAALTGSQTGGKPPAGNGDAQLTDDQLAICKSMGVSPEDYAKTLQETATAQA